MSEFIEFGEMTFADAAREEYSDWVCPVDDDKRQKTVAFVSDTPESVLQQIEAEALESRAEDRQRSEMAPPLGEGTRERIKELGGFEGNNTTFSWRSAKGVFTREGIPESRFNEMLSALADYDDPVEGAEAEIARLREADAKRGASSLSGDGSVGEEDILEDRRAADQARTVQGEGCDHARGHCENGDLEACEFLQNACGYDSEETAELMGALPDGGTVAEDNPGGSDFGISTPGENTEETEDNRGDSPASEEITGKAAGALSRSWKGYRGALRELGEHLDALRESYQNAQAAARAINGIRDSHGQEPMHFDALEAANADVADALRKMAQVCEECHADHSEHSHDVDAEPIEDIRQVVNEGADVTPVGISDETAAAVMVAPAYEPEHIPEDGERETGEHDPVRPGSEDPDRDTATVPDDPGNEILPRPLAPSDPRIERQSARALPSEADERAQERHRERMDRIAAADAERDPDTPDGSDVIETDDQQTLGGGRANPQARLAGGETGEVETEFESTPEENTGGLMADERNTTDGGPSGADTEQATPDAFQVAEGGQNTLGEIGDPEITDLAPAIEELEAAVDGYGDRISMDNEVRDRLTDAGYAADAWTEQNSQDVFRYGIAAGDVRSRLPDDPETRAAIESILIDLANEQ